MSVEKELKTVCSQIKEDKELRMAWQANLAMAFKDRVSQYKREHNKQALSREDYHIIANEAADYFLDLLCTQTK